MIWETEEVSDQRLLECLRFTHDARLSVFDMQKSTIWSSGEQGYHTYRIPALAVTNAGTVLSICEGRRDGQGDTGKIDLLVKRSMDGGATWSEQSVIWTDGENVCGNPAPIVDRETGTVWLLSTWNKGSDHEGMIIDGTSEDTRRVFVISSEDDGLTWSVAREITATAKHPDWSWYATGPGSGIQLQHGEHAGRLVMACDHIEKESRYYYSHVIISDDHGATWRLGGSTPRAGVNECLVVELTDGRLLMNTRNESWHIRQRQQAFSDDGGETWRDQFVRPDLFEPRCQASLHRGPNTAEGKPTLLFANPSNPDDRSNLTVRGSDDEGLTWTFARELQPGPAAYSDLAVLGDGQILCAYEAGEQHAYERIDLVRMTWDELVAGR